MKNEKTTPIDLNTIEAVCKQIAADEHTLIDIRHYDDYGWSNISFETDAFGGCYVNLHVSLETGKVHNWYGNKEREQEISTLEQLRFLVHREKVKMLKARDMKGVADFINSEY